MATGSIYTGCTEGIYGLLAGSTPLNAWAHMKWLLGNQRIPYENLRAIQWQKLKALLGFAQDNIPFYRRLWNSRGIDARAFGSADDLSSLPVVTKRDINEGSERKELPLPIDRRHDYARTSGTTGRRFKVAVTFSGFQKKYAGYLRQVYACGWRLGVKSAALHYSGHTQFKGRYNMADDHEPFSLYREAALALAHRRRVLTPYYEKETGNENFPASWYRQLKSYSPYMFETIDFQILILKDYIERNGLRPLEIPKMYILNTFSEKLRSRLERFFKTEIFDRYSPRDTEGVAFECDAHKGMHMAIDSYCVEFLDRSERHVRPGETGNIIITDLDNYAMPLIRYEVGDIGRYYAKACPCGRTMPLMGGICGRTADLLKLKNDKIVPPADIAQIFQDDPDVVLFQVTQSHDRAITAAIVPKRPCAGDTAMRIEDKLRVLLGQDEKIYVRCAEKLNIEHTGKLRFFKPASNNWNIMPGNEKCITIKG